MTITTWDSLYNLLGIRDFIYFISSSQIQDMLFPVKLVFVFCSAFFLVAVIYFMLNSSWLQYKFLEDVTEFFSWSAFGQREMQKQWDRIKKRAESGAESDYKLAIIDADDFLAEVLDNRGYDGDTFEESIQKAGRLIASILDDVLKAHEIRNSIVYNPDFKLSTEHAKKVLDTYETAAKEIGMS
ncbi:MAG: hypothetical protein NTY81_02820 [Candidatus Staskawiczbacteria bacterium]|nr:hypothetical protein [Candidatus Staskawiczbacteria bacterium]